MSQRATPKNIEVMKDANGCYHFDIGQVPMGITAARVFDENNRKMKGNWEMIRDEGKIQLIYDNACYALRSIVAANFVSFEDKVTQFLTDKCPDIEKVFSQLMNMDVQDYSVSHCEVKDVELSKDKDKDKDKDKGKGGNRNFKKIRTIRRRRIVFDKLKGRNMIVKGYIQQGKTNFILSSAINFLLQRKTSIIVCRNNNGDKDQTEERLKEYDQTLRDFLGYEFEDKQLIKHLSPNDKVSPNWFNGRDPRIIVVIANEAPLKKITDVIGSSKGKEYALFKDEDDFIDSLNTRVQAQLVKLMADAFCSFAVSATIIESSLKNDILSGNVILLSKPENYIGLERFNYNYLFHKQKLSVGKADCPFENDLNLTKYVDDFSKLDPIYVPLYDTDGKGDPEKCYHPQDTLLRVSTANEPNRRALWMVSKDHPDIAVMQYQSSCRTGKIGQVIAHIKDVTTPITLSNGCKSEIITKLHSDSKANYPGKFHLFKNASPSKVKEYLKKNGGVVKYPRIMTFSGNMAARCQSFGAADFSECMKNNTIGWHLTQMYLIASMNGDQPELMQTAGRLCIVARDHIPLQFYSHKDTCLAIIKSYWLQEELVACIRKVQSNSRAKDILKALKIAREKVPTGRSITKKLKFTPKTVSLSEDKAAGGWDISIYKATPPNPEFEEKEREEKYPVSDSDSDDFDSDSDSDSDDDEKNNIGIKITKPTGRHLKLYNLLVSLLSNRRGVWVPLAELRKHITGGKCKLQDRPENRNGIVVSTGLMWRQEGYMGGGGRIDYQYV